MLDKYSHNSFYLVRHGEAENNVLRILDGTRGKREYSLTETGRTQAEETAGYLRDQGIDFIVSSFILRAKQTASIIQETLAVPLSFDERLGESHFGKFEDGPIMTFLDFMAAHGGRLHGLMDEGIEGYVDVRERVRGFLMATSKTFSGKKIVVVSHGDPLQEIYGELMGIDPEVCEGGEGWSPKLAACMLVSKEKNEEYVPQS